MLQGKGNYTSPTTQRHQHWQQWAGGYQIILLPRRCYQQIGWLLQCNYLTYQICLEKVLWTNPYSCNKSFSVANRGQMCNYRVISTVLYTCKTWPKILKIYQSCQRQIYRWWDGYPLLRYQTYSVNELREKLKRRSAEEQIKSLHLRWLGHLAIMNIQYWPKIMLNCNVLGAYPSGHPKKNNGQH